MKAERAVRTLLVPRWAAGLLAAVAVGLVPWTLYLT
jgi:hypothetical protein